MVPALPKPRSGLGVLWPHPHVLEGRNFGSAFRTLGWSHSCGGSPTGILARLRSRRVRFNGVAVLWGLSTFSKISIHLGKEKDARATQPIGLTLTRNTNT